MWVIFVAGAWLDEGSHVSFISSLDQCAESTEQHQQKDRSWSNPTINPLIIVISLYKLFHLFLGGFLLHQQLP